MIRISWFLLLLVGIVYSQNDFIPCSKKGTTVGVYYNRHPKNCSLYDVCLGNVRLATMSCGLELVFSNAYSNCVRVDGLYADCDEEETPGGVYNDPLCLPHPNGLNVDPSNCSRYIPCFNMTSKPVMRCQASLYFSFPLQRCVGKDKVICKDNKDSTSTPDHKAS